MAERQGQLTPAGSVSRSSKAARRDLGLQPTAPIRKSTDRRRRVPVIRFHDDDDADDDNDADDDADRVEPAEEEERDIRPAEARTETQQEEMLEATLSATIINWYDDLERKTLLEHRKIVQQLATKEKQMAETTEHIQKETCPKSIKATAQLQPPEFLKSQVDAKIKEITRDYEKAVLQVHGMIREAESDRLKMSLQQLFPRHTTEIQKRKMELVNAGIIPENAPYDTDAFRTRLNADAQKTRFLMHKAEWAKQEKRDKLAEKKAAERVDEALMDPEMAQLRKEMEQLKRSVASRGGTGGGKAASRKSGDRQATKAKAKAKDRPAQQKQKPASNTSSGHGSGKAKNVSGPGKKGGRRGPSSKQPQSGRQGGGKAGGHAGPRR